jgi:hypothetical protein
MNNFYTDLKNDRSQRMRNLYTDMKKSQSFDRQLSHLFRAS